MKALRAAGTLALLVMPAWASALEPPGKTTLANPGIRYEIVRDASAVAEAGDIAAWIVTNSAIPPLHRAGYNGLLEIRHKGEASPFVPDYAGLNLEHVINGRAYADSAIQFEPRRHPMQLRKIDAQTFELYQAALPESGLESATRFEPRAPHAVDCVFECIPRKDDFPFGHLTMFWASYIQEPEDKSIYFLGRKKGSRGEEWIQGVTPKHGELSTHRGAGDARRLGREEPYPLTLVFNESEYEYTRPFYYGRHDEFVWIVMFRAEDRVRFTQSPSGGGKANPAWDFQWTIDNPKKDELYRLEWRAVWKPWVGREDVVKEYELFEKTIPHGGPEDTEKK